MKLAINKNLRIALLAIIIIIIGIASFFLYRELKVPSFEEQKTPQYSYINKGAINYKVYLKPNNLYEENLLDEGGLYINEFVDHILAEYNYEFNGDKEAQISGEYDIFAQIQGFTGDAEKKVNLWEKNFPIVSNRRFSSNYNSILIKEKTKINLEEYNTFAKGIIEASKVSCQTSLSILFNIDVKAVTENGLVEEVISPSLIIPLNTSMFEVKSTNIDKPGAIEETNQVQLPVNTKQVLLYGIIIGILSLVLIFLIFFIKTAPNKDPYEKKLNQIFKKHGDRLVALNNDLIITANYSNVKSIDDLVRIADEVSKPIMYKYSEYYKEIDKFYVTHEDEIYIFNLEELKVAEKVEEIEEAKVTNISEEV